MGFLWFPYWQISALSPRTQPLNTLTATGKEID
jgi:hypothetical protein